LTEEVFDRFLRRRWPGDVRELENVVERIVVFARNNEIGIANLPEFLQPASIFSMPFSTFRRMESALTGLRKRCGRHSFTVRTNTVCSKALL